MKTFLCFFQTIRIGNALISSAAVAIGWLYCNSNLPLTDLFFRIAAGFFALGYGNTINDICDIKTDKISHPNRPLVSGKITLRTAIIFAAICFVFSLVAGFYSSVKLGIATIIPLFILTLYSFFFKATPFSGNFIVALLTGYTLVFGGLGENFSKILYPAILAFLSNFAREIVKDLNDEKGDKAIGLKTTSSAPTHYIKAVICLQFIVFVAIIPLPYFFNLLGMPYLAITVFLALPLHFNYLKHFRLKEYKKASTALKLQMIAGLFAVIVDYILVKV
jgi:geranylgeranylglycerol-phosphate geranylgeranyltransferase